MGEERLRRSLDRAFDPGPNFPQPALLPRTIAMLKARPPKPRDAWRTARPARLLAAIAVVLAVVVVVTLVLAGQVMHSRPIVPVHPVLPPPHIPSTVGTVTCANYGPAIGPAVDDGRSVGTPGPLIVKAVDPVTLWARGGLLSTDGGSRWSDMSPRALREDQPLGIPSWFLPPEFVDFYLDAAHGWMARSYNLGSDARCYNYVGVFRTSDGGHTWQRSDPIAVPSVAGACCLYPRLSFIDSQHGWLAVGAGADARTYVTDNGAQTWRVVGTSECLNFITKSEATCIAGSSIESTVDGGATWQVHDFSMPTPPSCAQHCVFYGPVFFNPSYGIVHACDQYSGGEFLFDTHDGGQSWRPLPTMPATGAIGACPSNVVLGDAGIIWDLVQAPGTGRGSPTNAPPVNWLYHSADGGLTWILVNRSMPWGWPAVPEVFADAEHGFLLVQDAQDPDGGSLDLLVTNDGGHSWHELEPQLSG